VFCKIIPHHINRTPKSETTSREVIRISNICQLGGTFEGAFRVHLGSLRQAQDKHLWLNPPGPLQKGEPLPLPLNLSPGVAEGGGAVEDGRVGLAVHSIGDEIAHA